MYTDIHYLDVSVSFAEPDKVYPFIHLFIYLYIYPSIYLSTLTYSGINYLEKVASVVRQVHNPLEFPPDVVVTPRAGASPTIEERYIVK